MWSTVNLELTNSFYSSALLTYKSGFQFCPWFRKKKSWPFIKNSWCFPPKFLHGQLYVSVSRVTFKDHVSRLLVIMKGKGANSQEKKNYSNVLSILITGSSHPCIVIVYISNIFIYTCINSEIMHYNYPYLATLFVDYAIPIPNESSCTYICSYFIGNSNISFELLKTFINIWAYKNIYGGTLHAWPCPDVWFVRNNDQATSFNLSICYFSSLFLFSTSFYNFFLYLFIYFYFSPLPSSRVSATQTSARPSLLCVRLTRQSLQDQKSLLLQKQAS